MLLKSVLNEIANSRINIYFVVILFCNKINSGIFRIILYIINGSGIFRIIVCCFYNVNKWFGYISDNCVLFFYFQQNIMSIFRIMEGLFRIMEGLFRIIFCCFPYYIYISYCICDVKKKKEEY